MPQITDNILPYYVNTDTAYEKMLGTDTPFSKGVSKQIKSNPDQLTGTNNPTGEGQNQEILSPSRSNIPIPNVLLPTGRNKNIGAFESTVTQEMYSANFNSLGNHGVYVLDGNTGLWQTVIIDPKLNFSDEQTAYIAEHRWKLRVVYNSDHSIAEKVLILTDGVNWQKYIQVIASIKTQGFNANQFPYWTLQPPQFDRRELFEYAVRPIMQKPIAVAIPNTQADNAKVNRVIDTAFQFAVSTIRTDGRPDTFSPFSLPVYTRSEDYATDPDNSPKNILLTMPAGSPLTEKMVIYVRQCRRNNDNTVNTQEWGDWVVYDTIYKYTGTENNSANVIGTEYWLRTNPWATYNYNTEFNTIQYVFDNSRAGTFIDPVEAARLQSEMPQLSVAMTDLNDSVGLANNRYNYNNFGTDVLGNLDAAIATVPNTDCVIPLRTIKLYAYVGKIANFSWTSQVGYYVNDDTQERWGSLDVGTGDIAVFTEAESKLFGLDFASQTAFVCYLKGTPYYAVGVWNQVNSDNTYIPLTNLLNFGSNDVLTYVQSVFAAGGYFMCSFELQVPAGRYQATLGRHNVNITSDFRNQSTYIMGIANSRDRTVVGETSFIHPSAMVTFSKEQQIDCTQGNVDLWGNNADLFYIFCPQINGANPYRFVEGYLFESINNPEPVELFPYDCTANVTDAGGTFTDKNGFYFFYTRSANANIADVRFTVRLNCQYPVVFTSPTNQAGGGYRPGNTVYVSDHNNGVFGDCNRVLLNGTITSLDGTIPYSNISVSIYEGASVVTQQDGTFTLAIHNGQSTPRVSTIVINAAGSFYITIAGCGYVQPFSYDENLVPCVNCNQRVYPLPINLGVNVISYNQTSLKEGGSYSVGIVGADLAGRMMYVNVIKSLNVPTFLQQGNTAATFIKLFINGAVNLRNLYPDISWLSPYVSRNTAVLGYVQWVGDNIAFIDNNGNVVTDPAFATFVSITITSLYNANVANNFSTLARYQFVPGDRLRILDDGNNNLLTVAQYGTPIDVPILGTNYNQAAITADLIPNTSTNPVNNITINNTTNTTTNVNNSTSSSSVGNTAANVAQATAITLYVKYDSRFNKLLLDTGFWIEMYTPTQLNDVIPFLEVAGFYPVINGELAEYTGMESGVPQYGYPVEIDIYFWDTYYLNRNIIIPNVGSKYFSHPFLSPNISDTFGTRITSGGRIQIENKNAMQTWYGGDIIQSDQLLNNGFLNGIATFRGANRKDFSAYPWGAIQAILNQRSIILFICENDFFTTDFNFHYAYPNAQGVMITNLDAGLSTPRQKVGENFGVTAEDTSSVLGYDKYVFWYDRKNQAFILCNYQSAQDISDIVQEDKRYGIKSYLQAKTNFITQWNFANPTKNKFDVSVGVDMDVNNIMLSFRPRRDNTTVLNSYINERRNWELDYQETLVYSMDSKRWIPCQNYVPESYGKLRGNLTGTQLITFANGAPYTHNDKQSTSFLNYYGLQTLPVLMGVFNKDASINKIFQNLSLDINDICMWVDLIYTNDIGSFSYIPLNLFKKKENLFYAALLRNMVSYMPIDPQQLFRSTLQDGKRVFSLFMVFRLIGNLNEQGQYFELKNISNLFSASYPVKK